ncbi:Uncharacterized protein HZ326_2423 [Fusarium oxysporum f. sp. albedinis]|nr:Uncharacterized protein HZ326_2423 [Fusarium oxysporum f. sp. albedinis]
MLCNGTASGAPEPAEKPANLTLCPLSRTYVMKSPVRQEEDVRFGRLYCLFLACMSPDILPSSIGPCFFCVTLLVGRSFPVLSALTPCLGRHLPTGV